MCWYHFGGEQARLQSFSRVTDSQHEVKTIGLVVLPGSGLYLYHWSTLVRGQY
jgi:hypothetical protein